MLKVPVMGPLVQTEPPREMFLKGMNKKRPCIVFQGSGMLHSLEIKNDLTIS